MTQKFLTTVSLKEIVRQILNNEKWEPIELKETSKDQNFEMRLEVEKK